MAMATAKKPKKTPAEIRAIRREAGRKGGFAKGGYRSVEKLEKELMKEHIDQRLMRATDAYLNGQISLARGQQFLYRIDKIFVPSGGTDKETGAARGYWRNEKPVLVESQAEIEMYLEELADNNGELSDDTDPSSAYYFITTKEPNVQAIESGLSRVHGRPKESIDVGVNVRFSLVELSRLRDGIPDDAVPIDVDEVNLELPAP